MSKPASIPLPNRPAALAMIAMAAMVPPATAQVVIYGDALQSGFQNWSWGGGSDFAQTAISHAGNAAIAFTGNNFNGVSFSRPGQPIDSAQYGVLKLWVHGGSSGGQPLRLFVQSAGVPRINTLLAGHVDGGAITAATWREATVRLTAAPLSLTGPFDRIDLQSNAASAQATVYIDDVRVEAISSVIDPIFVANFDGVIEPGPAAYGLVVDRDVTVASMTSDRFNWRDAGGLPRSAVLAHNDGQTGPSSGYPNRGGALRELRYRLPNGSTRIAGATNYGNAGHGGFGYVVSHSGSQAFCSNGDDSPLGFAFPGTFQRVFEGRHHAIFRYTQNYPRYCTAAGPATTGHVAVTIDWLFSTGRDHPLWAISYDLSALPADRYRDDSRAPYGELNFDGTGSAAISGTAWGDRYRFTSTTAPVTLDSQWTWNAPNTVPWVKLWIDSSDATMGVVQTQTLAQQDAGARNRWYHDITPHWNSTSAAGNAGGALRMPWQDAWPYQANAYSIGPATASNNPRLTWGTSYGFLGATSYEPYNGLQATAPGWPRKSYSTFVVLGTHSGDPVGAQVVQVEALQSLAISAAIGSVASSGPAGVGRSDSIGYAPAGYDPVYSAITLDAIGNRIDASIAVASGSVAQPLIVLRNWSAGWPSSVRANGQLLIADVDYFASRRSGSQQLWITLNRSLGPTATRLEVEP